VQHDVLQLALVGQPLDVLERMPQDARALSIGLVAGLRVQEHDHGRSDFLVDLFVTRLAEVLLEGPPRDSVWLSP
jgi:hypothetical protein